MNFRWAKFEFGIRQNDKNIFMIEELFVTTFVLIYDQFITWFHELLFNESTIFCYVFQKKPTLCSTALFWSIRTHKYVKTGFVDFKFRFLM